MSTRNFKIKIDGRVFVAEVEEIGGSETANSAATRATTPQTTTPLPAVIHEGSNSITAPMPGKIVSVQVSKGKEIKAGDTVIILEAMKMEQEIKSSLSGTVKDILVSAGDTVKKEQALLVVE